MDKYIELKKENIQFYGDTEEMKKANEYIYDLTLELNRYQDMTQELWNYTVEHDLTEIAAIIKDWCC